MYNELTDEELAEIATDAREHEADFENYNEAFRYFMNAMEHSKEQSWG